MNKTGVNIFGRCIIYLICILVLNQSYTYAYFSPQAGVLVQEQTHTPDNCFSEPQLVKSLSIQIPTGGDIPWPLEDPEQQSDESEEESEEKTGNQNDKINNVAFNFPSALLLAIRDLPGQPFLATILHSEGIPTPPPEL